MIINYRKLYLLTIVIICLAINSYQSLSDSQMRALQATDYQKSLLREKDYYLIDVRTHWEYNRSHIENAVNISYLGGKFRKSLSTLDTSKPIFIYCETAHRSPYAANILHDIGFREIYDLAGGFRQWRKQNLPYVKP